jgi:hypothetical protein
MDQETREVIEKVGWAAEWEEKRAIEIAKELLVEGDSIDKIARTTKLPIDDIQALQ